MRMIVGVTLLVFGVISVGVANILHFMAEADLLGKRPDLNSGIYFVGGLFRRHGLVEKLYKAEFPYGRRIQNSRLCAIAGMLAFVSGLITLGFFK